MVIKLEQQEHFEQLLIDNERVVVDFYADWCGPCKMISPLIDELSEMVGDKFLFVKINVEAHQELCTKFNVRNIPTLILFQNGAPIATKTGGLTKVELLRFISNAN